MERQAESEDVARKLDVQLKQDGNTIRVHFSHKGGGWHDNASVNFKMSAPADSKLEVSTGGGGVSARGFSGGIRVDTGGGGIEIDGGSGPAMRSAAAASRCATSAAPSTCRRAAARCASKARSAARTASSTLPAAAPSASPSPASAARRRGFDGRRQRAQRLRPRRRTAASGGRPRGFHGNIGDGSGGSLEIRTGGGSIALVKP